MEIQGTSSTRKHVTEEQKVVLISFMKDHGDLFSTVTLTPQGRKRKLVLRQQLADQLNSCVNGVVRTAQDWIRTWNDHKCKAKAKAAVIAKHKESVGASPLHLTSWEQRIVALMSPEFVLGCDVEVGLEEETNPSSIETSQFISFPVEVTLDANVNDLLEAGPSSSRQSCTIKQELLADHEVHQQYQTSCKSTPETTPRRRKRRRMETRDTQTEVESNRERQNQEESVPNEQGQQQIAAAINNVANAVRDGLQAIARSQQTLAESLAALAKSLEKQ